VCFSPREHRENIRCYEGCAIDDRGSYCLGFFFEWCVAVNISDVGWGVVGR
jgi:hypothetical protein